DARDAVRIGRFYAPTTLEEAIAFKREHNATIVRGGTDVGVWINKRGYQAPAMLSLAKIAGLDELREDAGTILAGANVSLARLELFVRERIPELYKILSIFGSPQIKNAGTLAGNIANGSPIGGSSSASAGASFRSIRSTRATSCSIWRRTRSSRACECRSCATRCGSTR